MVLVYLRLYTLSRDNYHKKYIGQTQNIYKRCKEHETAFDAEWGKDRENIPLYRAIKKYKRENFEIYIIEECPIEELNDKEIFYIREFKTKKPNGYNLTDGGKSTRGYKHSEETKRKMSENHADFSGENHPMFGIHRTGILSPSFGKKIKNSTSKYYGVFFHKIRQYDYWESRIYITKSEKIYLGRYLNEIDAAKAYDKYVIDNNIPRPLNFPEDYK